MGDRSPKDKQKKQKQHVKEINQKQQHRNDNMSKNRHNQAPAEGEQNNGQEPLKRAG